jgi:hypothetical protein
VRVWLIEEALNHALRLVPRNAHPELVQRLADRVVELTPPVGVSDILETCAS